MKQECPSHYAQSHFHGDRPVDANCTWIRTYPLHKKVARGGCASFLSVEEICLRDRDKPLEARKLPRDLDIARAFTVQIIDALGVRQRPVKTGLEVSVPIDWRA